FDAAMADTEPSYIDYETFLDPSFSPTSFANTLVLGTNSPTDTPLDLSTPLSKVLFDIQEIDTHIHSLTTKNAIPLLESLRDDTAAGEKVVQELEEKIGSLNEGYERLEREVVGRYEEANTVRQVLERLWTTGRIGRSVSRYLQLCRQLEAQMSDFIPTTGNTNTNTTAKQNDDHRIMPRATTTISTIQTLLASNKPGEEGEGLSQINLVTSLQSSLVNPSTTTLRTRAQQIISQFSTSSLSSAPNNQGGGPTTFAQTEETKARTVSACLALWILARPSLLQALQTYLRTALTSSLASVARALANLPTLDRTLLEVSARCQNVVALESLLSTISPPIIIPDTTTTPSTPQQQQQQNLLQPLLAALDTSSLPSYFWRSLAEGLAPRVQDLIARGGAPARALRAQRETVREGVRG
ncbi:MAG: hypothetical protein Q9191_008369, partial [Dirinaria sp. TL-2023a]